MLRLTLLLAIILMPFLSTGQAKAQNFTLQELHSLFSGDYSEINDHLTEQGWVLEKIQGPNEHSRGMINWSYLKNKEDGTLNRGITLVYDTDNNENLAAFYLCSQEVFNALKAEGVETNMKKLKSGIRGQFIYTDYIGSTHVYRFEFGKDGSGVFVLFDPIFYYDTQYKD